MASFNSLFDQKVVFFILCYARRFLFHYFSRSFVIFFFSCGAFIHLALTVFYCFRSDGGIVFCPRAHKEKMEKSPLCCRRLSMFACFFTGSRIHTNNRHTNYFQTEQASRALTFTSIKFTVFFSFLFYSFPTYFLHFHFLSCFI